MSLSGIPSHFIRLPDGSYAHPSRVRGLLAPDQPKPDGGPALERQAPAPEGRGKRVARELRPKRNGSRGAQAGSGRVVVHLSARVERGRLLDGHDNLRAALKPLVDAIAETMGVPDDHPGIAWEYSQAETTGQACVIVTMENKSVDNAR